MTEPAPLNLGLIGCGRIAELGYLPAIAAAPGIELAAVADPSAARRAALAAACRARAARTPATHPGAGELVAAGAVDAVIVASPADRHREHAELAAAAGLPCLVEKPPAPDLAGARRLAELRPAPWLGLNRRFWQGQAALAAIPAHGPLELELELRYRRRTWRPYEVADDALADLGPHLVDLALLLAGGPAGRDGAGARGEAVAARAAAGARAEVVAARLTGTRAELELELPRGRAALRCATDRPHRERVVVRRPGGEPVVALDTGGPLRVAARRVRRGEQPLVGSLRRQLEAFARLVRGGEPGLLATAAEGVAVVAVLAAARRVAAGQAATRAPEAVAAVAGGGR